VNKAPGPGKLSVGAILLLWKWEKESMVRVMSAAIVKGRHQAVWKRASRVVIRKPSNDDYRKLKPNCSIEPVYCMGTVVEIVAAELPLEAAE